MLIKTRNFDIRFNKDLNEIKTDSNENIILKGSYKLKNYGSIITDIDLSQNVIISPLLIQNIIDIVKKLKNFIFVRLYCGTYIEFDYPWSITNNGDCKFCSIDAKIWFEKLQNFVDLKILKKIEKILFSKNLSLKKLLEIEDICLPYSEILWSIDDIERGYIIVREHKYDLLTLMQTNSSVIEYIYKYDNEYVSVDFGLMESTAPRKPDILREYYKENYYKIFKSYKWYLKREYFQDYINVIKKIENYSGLLNRIYLISTIVKYKLLPENEINNIITDSIEFSKKIEIAYSGLENVEATELELTKKIEQIILKYKNYFRERLQEKYIPEVEFYELRASNVKSIDNSENTSEDTSEDTSEEDTNCPFFYLSLENFNYVLYLSRKSLIDPKLFLKCVNNINIFLKTISLEKIFPKNNFSLIYENDFYIKKGSVIIRSFPKNELKKYQKLVLTLNK